MLFSAKQGFGYDENINFSDIHLDARFCLNWAALQSGGDIDRWQQFQFIGQVFKASHALTFAQTYYSKPKHHKGIRDWNYALKVALGDAVYTNPKDWGLHGYPEKQIATNIIYIG